MREFLSGIRVVKAFNRSDYEEARFSGSNRELANASMSVMRVMAGFFPSVLLAVNIGILAVLWYGGFRVNLGFMKTGQIMAFVNYITQILFSLIMLSFIFNMLVRARASAERIGAVFNASGGMVFSPNPISIEARTPRIEFESVSFSYASKDENTRHERVLEDISFSCSPGMTIGIIGSTGSGKTSLVNLLPRFHEYTDGCILLVRTGWGGFYGDRKKYLGTDRRGESAVAELQWVEFSARTHTHLQATSVEDTAPHTHLPVGRLLAAPEIAGGSQQFRDLSMEYSRLQPLAEATGWHDDLQSGHGRDTIGTVAGPRRSVPRRGLRKPADPKNGQRTSL